MPVLSVTDQALYFPDITMTGGPLERLLSTVNAIVEGPYGANRSLSLQQHQEIRLLNVELQSVLPSYWPIDVNQTITVETRVGAVRNRFRQPVGVTEWQTLDTDEYVLDLNGFINLQQQSNFLYGSYSPGGYGYHGGARRINATEVRLTYYAGFDFNSTSNAVKELKFAASEIASAIAFGDFNPTTGQTRKEEGQAQVDKIVYSSPKSYAANPRRGSPGLEGISPALLSIFQRYRAKGQY